MTKIKESQSPNDLELANRSIYAQCRELELTFLRYHVMGIKGRARSSLLLTFLAKLMDQTITVNCWIELGNGHKYLRGSKKGCRLPKGHFRVTDDTILYHWMIEMNLQPKNWAQAHIGFKKKCQAISWRGKVRAYTRDNGLLEYKTHISVLKGVKRFDESDVWRSANDDLNRWNLEQKRKAIPF